MRAWGYLTDFPPTTYLYKDVAAGWRCSLFLISSTNPADDGRIIALGEDFQGTVDDTPVEPGFRAIASGYYHNLAIAADETVRAWGFSDETNHYVATVPEHLTSVKVIAIAAGEQLSAVIRKDNQNVEIWGKSEAHCAEIPSSVMVGPFVEISAHGHHLLARRANGDVVYWEDGANNYNQSTRVPPRHPSGAAWGAFSAGHWHSMALDQNGVWFETDPSLRWGLNSDGQAQGVPLTNPPAFYKAPPVPLPPFRSIEGGYFHNTGLTVYGGLVAWGRNRDNQCNIDLMRVKKVSAQFDHGLAIMACYANCDLSTVPPILNANDFICFNNSSAAGDPTANCDGSTTPPVLDINDFVCFNNAYAAGCTHP